MVGRHDDANSQSYCVAVRSATKAGRIIVRYLPAMLRWFLRRAPLDLGRREVGKITTPTTIITTTVI